MQEYNKVKVIIEWVDAAGNHKKVIYRKKDLESAETQIGLITGTICIEDLKA